MRIALITPSTLPFSCGNSLLAERLRAGLHGRGHEVALFSIQTDNVSSAADFRPHIVHSLHAVKSALWVEKLFRETAAPWVITLTGTDYNSPEEYGAETGMLMRQFSQASAIVVFHEEARSWVAEHFPQAAAKLSIIAQGVRMREKNVDRALVRQRYGLAADEPLLLMAAGIRPVKNICFAFDVFAAVRQRLPNARLMLAGPVVDKAEASRVFEKGSMVPGFTYLGEISHDAVLDLMASADLFLNTSLHEGMPGAVLEAMAEGLPVVASDAPGNRSLVRHGTTGLLAPLASPDTFCEAACRVLADPGLKRAMSAAAVQAAQHYSLEREINGYEEVYNGLLQP